MLDLLARVLSFIFNPFFLLAPIPYLLVVRETADPVVAAKWTLISFLFLSSVALFVVVAVRLGYFSDLDVSKREHRPLLFLVGLVVSITYLLSLLAFNGPLSLIFIAGGILCSIVVFSVINTRIKASIHVASITSLIFAFSVLYGSTFLLLLFLLPVIVWSRVRIKRHTMQEAIIGGTTGILVTGIIYLIFKIIFQMSLSA
jgi:hypothetical protein